jgi:radical SAM superfamily enzyme YgiQ (UPF0313 family)
LASIILAAINAKWIHPSLALRLLKANLGALQDQCEILEFALRQPMNEKTRPLLAARPSILGLSVSIWNHLATVELLEALEKEWLANGKPPQRPVVVLGGPEVTWLPEDAEIFRHADFVIRGEGEEGFRSLCHEILRGDYRRNENTGAVFINPAAVSLNEIDLPYRLYTDEELRRKLVYVESSRGCPFACEFCQGSIGPRSIRPQGSIGPSNLRAVREFPLEAFLAEMETLIGRGARTFKFLDRTFNLDTGRAVKIMDFFLEKIDAVEMFHVKHSSKEKPFCVHFEMVPSPALFPPPLKETLRRFPPGTLRLELGIQTLNRDTAALINRPGKSRSAENQAPEELETLKFLRAETNAIIHADLIAGLPNEGLASFGEGFDSLWQTLSDSASPFDKPFEIQLGILKCLPGTPFGTPIARHNDTHKMRHSPEPPYEVIETGALPAAELARLKNFARFWELIVNRNPFPDLLPGLLPPGKPVFDRFMNLSDKLLETLGRNWGIDRMELRAQFMLYSLHE